MSWSSVKTEAVILSSHPWREADRRYRALTASHGKIEFIGRGAQKEKAKLASTLEPFAIVNVEYIKGRRSTTVIATDSHHRFRVLDTNLERRLLAESILFFLNRVTDEDEADSALYQMLIDWLLFLDDDKPLSSLRSSFLLGGFLLRLLSRLGYKVELRHCLDCKQDIFPLAFRWHARQGGLVCSDCVMAKPEEWFAAKLVSEEAIKLIRFARDERLVDLLRLPLSSEHLAVFANIVNDLVVHHLPGNWDRPFWTAILAEFELEEPLGMM
ncbi:MAG: DNA repair protein RecO [Patescibacteria group bacterium]|nr:DNA repair protein RecO [Patescibacteria group bacterium]